MKAADATISYLELLKLASPETIVVITALAVLAVGLGTGRVRSTTTVSQCSVLEVRATAPLL